jgi:hypothetical protein
LHQGLQATAVNSFHREKDKPESAEARQRSAAEMEIVLSVWRGWKALAVFWERAAKFLNSLWLIADDPVSGRQNIAIKRVTRKIFQRKELARKSLLEGAIGRGLRKFDSGMFSRTTPVSAIRFPE